MALASALPLTAPAQQDDTLQASLLGVAPTAAVEVVVGVRVDQVVSINQKSENFEVVGDLQLGWEDPGLAFDAEAYGQPFKMYTREGFAKMVNEEGVFAPAFSLHNQQGRRHTQVAGAVVFHDGQVSYSERFTAQLQAPEFQFTRYPFDTQTFYVRVRALFPTNFLTFTPHETYSRLGGELGEEGWIFAQNWIELDDVEGVAGQPTSRFSFCFSARRHLTYYFMRIFIPLGIIILVSWLTFFLQDFGKRVDIAGANLLIFVAFNFTIANDLPRLGYVTFMDALVVATFAFSGLVVAMNVIFRRMEVLGNERLARRIDAYTLWIYPAALAGLVLLCAYWLVVRDVGA